MTSSEDLIKQAYLKRERERQINQAKKIKPWIMILALFASLTVSVLQTPVALNDIADKKDLDKSGIFINGVLESYDEVTGKYESSSTAVIVYQVNGNSYQNIIKGRGARPEELPKTASVLVKYLPEKPSVSFVEISRAETPYFSWWEIIGLWLLTVLLLLTLMSLYCLRKK